MKIRRTLLTAGVFALLAMIYVPTPHRGYRLIFSSDDTSIAFFQLLVNVVFAALLGAILATIIPKLPRLAWRWITGIALIALFITGALAWRNFTEAAADRARFDEEFADSQLGYHYPEAAKFTLRNAARNWRLALRFDEATRVENRIKGLRQHTAQDWQRDRVVNLSGLPDQGRAQAPEATSSSGDIFDQINAGQSTPPRLRSPKKYISTDPNIGVTPKTEQFQTSSDAGPAVTPGDQLAKSISPHATGGGFAAYAMKLREHELLNVEPQVLAPKDSQPATQRFPWKTNIVTTVFWVGEKQLHKSVWDKEWEKDYGGVDNPDPSARRDYIPVAFVPRQNPFYCALPYNDVTGEGKFKPEARLVIPWFKQAYTGKDSRSAGTAGLPFGKAIAPAMRNGRIAAHFVPITFNMFSEMNVQNRTPIMARA